MAAPYGTRSRNRNGNARPNYAEDKDYDVDMYDFDHDKSQTDPKRSSRSTNGASHGDSVRSNASSRKSLGDESKVSTPQSGSGSSKEQTSNSGTGASQATQASSNASQPSRKRKAGAAAQQQLNSAPATTKKNGSATPQVLSTSWSESNVLTFANCKARTQNGRLVADDGTVLEANGTYFFSPKNQRVAPFPTSSTTYHRYRSCVPCM